MRVDGMLSLVMALLQREGRVSYWALKQEFGFDDAFLEGLTDELIFAMTKGHGAPEVEATYTQARALCRQLGDTPQLFPVLFGLWRFYIVHPPLAS